MVVQPPVNIEFIFMKYITKYTFKINGTSCSTVTKFLFFWIDRTVYIYSIVYFQPTLIIWLEFATGETRDFETLKKNECCFFYWNMSKKKVIITEYLIEVDVDY